jgi:hypothetical protein
VPVDAGRTQVRFEYHPPALGLTVSFAAALAIACAYAWVMLRIRSGPDQQSAD